MLVVCAVCESKFDASRASAKYCGPRCRQLAKRRRDSKPEQVGIGSKPKTTTPAKRELVEAVRKELVEADRLETVAGQLALELAAQVTAAGATGIAGLSKELRTVMAEALAGAQPKGPVTKDQVGEARRKRDAKKARQAAHRA